MKGTTTLYAHSLRRSPVYYRARRAPSRRSIEDAFGYPADVARRIRGILSGVIDTMEYPDAVERRIRCHGIGLPLDYALEALNAVMGGFGVEYLRSNRDGLHCRAGLSYVNQGDTYVTTLIYDHEKDLWLIASWGDLVEADQRRFEER